MAEPAYTLPLNDLINLRRKLHKVPEIAGNERLTAGIVQDFFKPLSKWEIRDGIGGNGFMAIYNSGQPGENLLFRCELDALPQQDACGKAWQSDHAGAAHACGHDGHMTILAGLASLIQQCPPRSGAILLLFQPAEEDGSGAEACLQHPVFDDYPPDFVFALHNIPGKPAGQIIIREGAFTASVKSAIIKLQGKLSHAAEPELGNNPLFFVSALTEYSKTQQNSDIGCDNFFLITPTFLRIGEKAHGTTPGEGEWHITFRAWNDRVMDQNLQVFMYKMSQLSKDYQIRTSIRFTDIFPSIMNHPSAMERIVRAAAARRLTAETDCAPFRWGEDFGVFTRKYKGAMCGIGAGESWAALHSSQYDFPDFILEEAVYLLNNIIRNR